MLVTGVKPCGSWGECSTTRCSAPEGRTLHQPQTHPCTGATAGPDAGWGSTRELWQGLVWAGAVHGGRTLLHGMTSRDRRIRWCCTRGAPKHLS